MPEWQPAQQSLEPCDKCGEEHNIEERVIELNGSTKWQYRCVKCGAQWEI